ncbi:MAG: hypothetical protein GWP14_04810 [Actinobacteria bacterium]|nr:hypothetical protein [Actinomycetota bacterium]
MSANKKNHQQTDLESTVSELHCLAEKIRRQIEQELARLEKARLLAATESDRLEALLAQTQPGPDPPSKRSPTDKHHQIYKLAEEGLEPLEIAQQTGQSLGEIQLLLALRKSE